MRKCSPRYTRRTSALFDDLRGRALGQHVAVADDVGVVADAQRFAHVVVGDQHADAARLQEADDALDLDHGDRVDAGEWLVQQDEARLRRQRARDLHTPPLAARQGERRRIAQVIHPQVLQQRRQPLLDLGARQGLAVAVALQFEHGAHVLLDIQLAEDRRLLRQVGQAQARAPVDRHVRHGPAVDRDLAGVGAHQPDDHVERSGLAGAVGAEQADDFALGDLQRDVLHHLAAAVGLLQVPRLQPAPARPVPPRPAAAARSLLAPVQGGAGPQLHRWLPGAGGGRRRSAGARRQHRADAAADRRAGGPAVHGEHVGAVVVGDQAARDLVAHRGAAVAAQLGLLDELDPVGLAVVFDDLASPSMNSSTPSRFWR